MKWMEYYLLYCALGMRRKIQTHAISACMEIKRNEQTETDYYYDSKEAIGK